MSKRALTFRASSIGDSLMGKYFLENVRAAYPDAKCGIIVASRAAMIRDLFRGEQWLEVIEASRRNPKGLQHLWNSWRGTDITLTQYAGKGGDFSLTSKLAARLLTRSGGAIGFSDSFWGNSFLYDHIVPLIRDAAPACMERKALTAAQIPIAHTDLSLAYEHRPDIFETLSLSGPYLLLHLFAGNPSRGLSFEHKKDLLHSLRSKWGNEVQIILTGSKSEREETEKVIDSISNVRSLAGDIDLQELMNLMQKSMGIVSVDTGVAHIAAHLKIPLIVLRTCVGKQWWSEEQYPSTRHITQFSKDECCREGHVFIDFPACINSIDFAQVACTASSQFKVTNADKS